MTRAAIYARVSTKDKGQEVENQLRQLREFAALQGWTVSREYVDHETAKNGDRAEFQSMFRDASQRKFDVLLFWALDRLSREGVLETLQHLNRLTSYGIGYRSFTEQYFDSCGIFRDAVIAIIATVAKQERIRISQRVKAGLETARAKGKKLGRPRVIVDAARINRLRSQGRTLREIADELGYSRGLVHKTLANSRQLGVANAAD
jgi:DNA invertase Pin-like site-specific DNA recombinase